jgi:hypothetical protein
MQDLAPFAADVCPLDSHKGRSGQPVEGMEAGSLTVRANALH